jgi:hypothetical protein
MILNQSGSSDAVTVSTGKAYSNGIADLTRNWISKINFDLAEAQLCPTRLPMLV